MTGGKTKPTKSLSQNQEPGTTRDLQHILELMKLYKVSRIEYDGIKIEMAEHYAEPKPKDKEPTDAELLFNPYAGM